MQLPGSRDAGDQPGLASTARCYPQRGPRRRAALCPAPSNPRSMSLVQHRPFSSKALKHTPSPASPGRQGCSSLPSASPGALASPGHRARPEVAAGLLLDPPKLRSTVAADRAWTWGPPHRGRLGPGSVAPREGHGIGRSPFPGDTDPPAPAGCPPRLLGWQGGTAELPAWRWAICAGGSTRSPAWLSAAPSARRAAGPALPRVILLKIITILLPSPRSSPSLFSAARHNIAA